MTQTRPVTTINYIHDQPESLSSKFVKLFIRVMRLKGRIERDMKSGKIDQTPAKIPKSLMSNFDMEISELNGRTIWTFKPKHNASDQVILYMHGGAYIYNVSSIYWQFIEQLLTTMTRATTRATIVIPDYPLAPQASYADAFDFMDAVYRGLLDTVSPDKIIFMGDSAGGGLALGYAQHLRNDHKPLPQQLILLSPWLDITMSNPDIRTVDKRDVMLGIRGLQLSGAAYAGDLDPHDYRVSPLYGDLSGLPPMSVFIGTHDVFIADCRKLKQKMQAANLPLNYFEYPNMMHVWMLIVSIKEGKQAMEQIATLIANRA